MSYSILEVIKVKENTYPNYMSLNNDYNRNFQYNFPSNFLYGNLGGKELGNNIDYMNYVGNQSVDKSMSINKSGELLEPYQGFIRGNIFNNLYDPYKSYKPAQLNPTNEREALLNQWQQYNFYLVDLNLYLDLYPNDQRVLNIYNNILETKKQITDKYESKYGPLTVGSKYVGNDTWRWNSNPWPWEGEA